MTRFNFILIIIFSFSFLRVSAQTSIESFEIYSCVLSNFQKAYENDSLNLLIVDSTCTSQFRNHNVISDSVKRIFLNSEKYNIENIHELGKDFIESTKTQEQIPIELTTQWNFKVITQDSLDNILEITKDSLIYNLSNFYGYIKEIVASDGFCKFSSPYYFNDKFAIVYFQYSLGEHSGGGYTYILEKKNDKWKIIAEIWQWIS